MSENEILSVPPDEAALRKLAAIVYGLQALTFVVGLTFFAGAVINYIKQGDVRGTWLESHFRWQLRTFWVGLLWAVIGAVLTLFMIGYLVLLADSLWIVYRIVQGWLRLSEGKPLPVT